MVLAQCLYVKFLPNVLSMCIVFWRYVFAGEAAEKFTMGRKTRFIHFVGLIHVFPGKTPLRRSSSNCSSFGHSRRMFWCILFSDVNGPLHSRQMVHSENSANCFSDKGSIHVGTFLDNNSFIRTCSIDRREKKSVHNTGSTIDCRFLIINFRDRGNSKTWEIRRLMGVDKICGFLGVDTVRRDQIRFKITHELQANRELFINICEFEYVFANFRIPGSLQTINRTIWHVWI